MKKIANISDIGDKLNGTGKWFTSTDGTPSLYALHSGLELVDSTDTTHTHKCSCGVEGIAAKQFFISSSKSFPLLAFVINVTHFFYI